MKLEECLRQLMIDDYGSVAKFAEYAELPKTTVYNILKRGIAGGSFDVVQKIYGVLGIGWHVISMDNNLDYEDFKKKRDERRSNFSKRYVDVPLFGSIAAGTPIEMIPVDETHPVPDVIHERYPDAFLLRVKGESMNRIIPNGSYVLVDPKQRDVIVSGQPYVVCVNGFDATVKRVKTLANGIQLIPDSDDPTYPVQTFDFADPDPDAVDATVIGRVVWYCIPFDWKF